MSKDPVRSVIRLFRTASCHHEAQYAYALSINVMTSSNEVKRQCSSTLERHSSSSAVWSFWISWNFSGILLVRQKSQDMLKSCNGVVIRTEVIVSSLTSLPCVRHIVRLPIYIRTWSQWWIVTFTESLTSNSWSTRKSQS